jgi:hypothetical protein
MLFHKHKIKLVRTEKEKIQIEGRKIEKRKDVEGKE